MNDDERMLEHAVQKTDELDGFYSIDLRNDGLYLAVHSPQGSGTQVREPVVFEDLKKRGIAEYNRSLTLRAIREAKGEAVKIAEVPAAEVDSDIQVIVDRDRMEASLKIVLPKNSRPVTLDFIMQKIQESGIVFGVDHAAIKKAFERPGLKVICAKGQRPSDGINGHIEYHIDLENKGKPVEQEDGRVDFKSLNMFTTVYESELLAEKIPPTVGVAGTDVLGQPAAAKPGKDIPLPMGKNVKAIDGNKLIAGIAGQLVFVNNKINIIPVIEVKEDVDLSTGNIEFVGSVVVRGSVQAGFTVKAQGDVEIYGNVSGGIVEGRNINIRMGIQGMHRGYIKATENVIVKFIENATVVAGKDVTVSDVILHSKVSAGKKVTVGGRRGLIAGGTVTAGEEILAKVAGTHMATNTELEVGVNPVLREEYQNIRKEIKKLDTSLDQAIKALNILKSMDQTKLPPDRKEMLLKLTKAQFHLAGQIEALRNRNTEIELALEEMKYGRIRIADIVYPGVK
ncbi:MAG TPA: FapA family protein, partial [Clostridia bacterium]|nr:FapA family protein [Clostridia bacterium]